MQLAAAIDIGIEPPAEPLFVLTVYDCWSILSGPVNVVGSQFVWSVTTPSFPDTEEKGQFLMTNVAVPSALNSRVPNGPFHVPCAASRKSWVCCAAVAFDCACPDCSVLLVLLALSPLRLVGPVVLVVFLLRPLLALPPLHDASSITTAANATSDVPMTGWIRLCMRALSSSSPAALRMS